MVKKLFVLLAVMAVFGLMELAGIVPGLVSDLATFVLSAAIALIVTINSWKKLPDHNPQVWSLFLVIGTGFAGIGLSLTLAVMILMGVDPQTNESIQLSFALVLPNLALMIAGVFISRSVCIRKNQN